MIETFVHLTQWIFLVYMIGLNIGYMTLNLNAVFFASTYMKTFEARKFIGLYTGYMPPVSILVPAYNEELTIESSVRSLLQLDYPQYEVVVINDGSTDGTIEKLKEAFLLQPLLAIAFPTTFPPLKNTFFSTASHPFKGKNAPSL